MRTLCGNFVTPRRFGIGTALAAALIAKTALATGGTIAEVAESLGIMSRAEMNALLVPERLTQPIRLLA